MARASAEELARGGLMEKLGIELREVSAERVVATMTMTPDHHQPFSYLHGGASVALAETAASIGGYAACPSGKAAFGMEINANHVRPVREGVLTATAVPFHRGRTTHVWEVRIEDARGRLVCISRCTLAIVTVDRDVTRDSSLDEVGEHRG